MRQHGLARLTGGRSTFVPPLRRLAAIAALASCVHLLAPVPAGAYPDKPIQFLVGFVAGSITDVSARALAKVAPKHVGVPLVVVNMPGAASTNALNELARTAPDGHVIALMTTTYPSLVVHQQKVPFDPKVLKPLLAYGEFRQLLFVKGDSPYARLDDLLAFGKKSPSAIKFGHSGRGTSIHLQGLLFFRGVGVEAADVPYRGSAEYVQAVIGGHIMAGVIDIAGVKQHIRAGTVKPVVAFLDQRFPELPDVPTAQERGVADLAPFNPLVSIAIHRDTPPDRVRKLHEGLKKAIEDPEFTRALDTMGLKGGYIAPEVVEDTIRRAEARGVPVLKELKLLAE